VWEWDGRSCTLYLVMVPMVLRKSSEVSAPGLQSPSDARVDHVPVLSEELQTGMRLLGVTSLDELRPHMVNCSVLQRDVTPTIGPVSTNKSRL